MGGIVIIILQLRITMKMKSEKVNVYICSPLYHPGYSFSVKYDNTDVILMDFFYSISAQRFHLRLFSFKERYSMASLRNHRKRLGGHHGLSKMANYFVKHHGVDYFYKMNSVDVKSMASLICGYVKRYNYIESIDWFKRHHNLDYWSSGWNSNISFVVKDKDE